MRYIYQDTAVDGKGNAVTSATVAIYEAGTTTPASIYTASSGGSAVASVTTDSTNGTFSFYVDDGDYVTTQKFKISVSKTIYITITIDDIKIFPASSSEIELESVSGKYLKDLFDGGYDVPIKPSKIFGGGTNTTGHTVPNVADDTITLVAATQNLTNKTLATPTIASMINANHDHSNAAGGGPCKGQKALYRYVVATTVDGGTSVTATWNVRPFNTEEYDDIGISLSGNQFTVPAGTYRITATGMAVEPQSNQMAIYNTTDTSYDLVGLCCNDVSATSSAAVPLVGEITLAAEKVLELRHYTQLGVSSTGLGVSSDTGQDEVYASIEFEKVG